MPAPRRRHRRALAPASASPICFRRPTRKPPSDNCRWQKERTEGLRFLWRCGAACIESRSFASRSWKGGGCASGGGGQKSARIDACMEAPLSPPSWEPSSNRSAELLF